MNLIRSLAWQGVKLWVRHSFASVPTVSTAALEDRLNSNRKPLLIDTRKAEEYALSHIPTALKATTVADVEAVMQRQDTNPSDSIVLYCSIGYRSGRLSAALQEKGYRVLNLEGAIFQWANEGRSLISNSGPTRQVHPYNRLWALLLSPN